MRRQETETWRWAWLLSLPVGFIVPGMGKDGKGWAGRSASAGCDAQRGHRFVRRCNGPNGQAMRPVPGGPIAPTPFTNGGICRRLTEGSSSPPVCF